MVNLARFFLDNDNFVIGIHSNPDGDCFGSACALAFALQVLGKKACILSPNAVPERLKFINCCGVRVHEGLDGCKALDGYDKTLVTVDVASDHLLGDLKDIFVQESKYAIDHHPSNSVTSESVYVDSDASACGEIIYRLIKNIEKYSGELLFDEDIASCIYAAISSDTGCFKYSNVTTSTHMIAAHLLTLGAKAPDINYRLFDLKSKVQLDVEAMAYRNIELYEHGKISFIYFSDDMLKTINANKSDTETVSQIGRGIEGVQIAVFMRQQGKDFKCSVRSNNDADMSALCASIGIGGGHKKAAGCTIVAETAEKAKEMFLEKAKEYLE